MIMLIMEVMIQIEIMKNSCKMVHPNMDDPPPVDRNERSDELSSSGNLASNFEKVTAGQNTSKEKVYDNMQSADVDSQFQLHEESNRHESINKVPKLIDQKRKYLEKIC